MAYSTTGTVDQLIESASRRGNIPNSQMTYLTSDFLAIAQEELEAYALPLLHSRREDYYLEELTFDYAKPDRLVGTPGSTSADPAWRLPEWAMASAIRDVQAVSPGNAVYSIGRINVDDVPQAVVQGWYFYGPYIAYRCNQLAAFAPPVSVRVVYHVKPNTLIVNDTAVDITPFRITSTEFSPGDPTLKIHIDKTFVAGGNFIVDYIRGTTPYEVYQRNMIVNVNPGENFFTAAFADYPTGSDINFQAGDWISLAGTTPLVPLPHELHALLAQRMVVKFLEAQGDQEQLEQSRKTLGEMATQIPLLIQPRAEGKPKKLANRVNLWRRWRW